MDCGGHEHRVRAIRQPSTGGGGFRTNFDRASAISPRAARDEARVLMLYRRLHRNSEARRIEDRLRKLLAFADADHPILKELAR